MEPQDRIAGLIIRLERKRRLAQALSAWERVWRCFWPLASWLGVVLGLALLGLFTGAGVWGHPLLLLAALAVAAFLARDGARRFVWPDPRAADHWLETRNGIPHAPLTALNDLPVWGSDDPATTALWRAHMAAVAAIAERLRPRWPSPGVPALDPLGVRAIPVLLLAVGLTVAGDDAARRLYETLTPKLLFSDRPVTAVQAWIDPPEYTGLPQLALSWARAQAATEKSPLTVPAGSRLSALIDGGASPGLTLDGAPLPVTRLDDGSHRVEAVLTSGGLLALDDDGSPTPLGRLDVAADAPPKAAFVKPPYRTGGWRLGLSIAAEDDFGLTGLRARITPLYLPEGPPLEIPLLLPPGAPRAATIEHVLDLSAHAWAGREVVITAIATDALGREGATAETVVTVPERQFTHPVARTIIEQRQKLAVGETKPEAAAPILLGLAADPTAFGGDRVVFLALRTAGLRLGRDPAALPSRDSMGDLLWQTATRLEDGHLASAQRSMDSLEKALTDALTGNAGSTELFRLTEMLKEAIRDYMRGLARDYGDQGYPPLATPPGTDVLTFDDLTTLLDSLRELSAAGSKDAAQALLQRLQGMLQALKEAPLNKPSREAMEAARRLMRDLEALSSRQEGLLGRAFDRLREAADFNKQTPKDIARRKADSAADADAQTAVKADLDGLLGRLRDDGLDPPAALDDAARKMAGAAGNLRDNQVEAAKQTQGEALDALRRGTQEAMNAMAQKLLGQGMMTLGAPASPGRDPLGRPAAGAYDDGSVKIPGRSSVRRSREILDELRQRAADPKRPPDERDYLDRLLKNF